MPDKMSRPTNMLRTRRKDCNLKPNRRLDRKSSRGMLYENEELRLKTININAEVESRQSDIKKLKRENEMLKKGLWYLRDEYDKLEKLIKDKKLDFSSSSTTCSTTSDSESCSSCSEESYEVETTQNIRNVQRTNLRNIQDQFEQLSVVTEETSAENSEQNSNRTSFPKETWNNNKDDVIKPDQSYPVIYKNLTKSPNLSVPQDSTQLHFFSPIKPSKSFDDNHFNQLQSNMLYPEYCNNPLASSMGNLQGELPNDQYDTNGEYPNENYHHAVNCETFLSEKTVQTNASNFYQNMVLVPKSNKPQCEARTMDKSSTDLIVKIDNQNFNNRDFVFSNTPSQSTFSNGGNLEELLNEIESISQRGSNSQNIQQPTGIYDQENCEFMQNVQNPVTDHLAGEHGRGLQEKPFKSELNVVLIPNPMPLIGFDKYKNIQRSFESLNSKPLEELSVSQQDLCLIPPPPPLPPPQSELLNNLNSNPMINVSNGTTTGTSDSETNPFFFGHFKDNYVNADYFSIRYNPENFILKENQKVDPGKMDQKSNSKTNLLDINSSEHISSENEENLKFKTTRIEQPEDRIQQKPDQNKPDVKSPKMSIRKKVSIHFKGKKDKTKKTTCTSSDTSIPRTPNNEKKHSLFDIKFGDKDKEKTKSQHQKAPSIESKKSATETSNQEPKTPTSSDSKTSTDKKSDKKDNTSEKKARKSVSISPDRSKHVHGLEEGCVKKHRKHKKGEKSRTRRPSVTIEPRSFRERSFSVCTDRSIGIEQRLGLGLGLGSSFMFEDYSDRERTNSMSSSGTTEHARKMSTMSNVPLSGKVPWCGCWGNGCL